MSAANEFEPDDDDTGGWSFYDGNVQPSPRWLIKSILPETGSGLLSGQWGTYKTTIALDLSLSVMAGIPFAGRYRVKRHGAVLYFAPEGASLLARRLAGMAVQRGVTEPLPFAWRSDCPALTASDAADRICALVQQAQIERRFELPLALVWIDTIITAAGYTATGDDNDAAAAQRVMSTLATVSRNTGAFVCGVDHFGKITETGTRGSSAKEGAADTVLAALGERELSGAVKNSRLALRKQRDGIQGVEIPFTAKVVETGRDDDGDPITAVVIDWEAPQAVQQTEGKWSPSLQLLRRILMNTLADVGRDVQPFLDGPVVRACDVEIVRREFYKQHAAEGTETQKTNARRQAFGRALKAAQASNLIATREIEGVQLVWLARPET